MTKHTVSTAAPVVHKVTRTIHASAPVAPAPAATAPAPAAPVAPVDTAASPPPPAQTAAQPANNDTALELGGGALALLALGGAAYAISRRRRRVDDDEWYDDAAAEPEHVEPAAVAEPDVEPRHDPVTEAQPAIVAPPMSAFAWGNPPQSEQRADGDDRRPGETWVERARRGPTPNNPSASLKNRLRRAAFFDKRERDVAAGKAEPVNPDAGLPEAMVEEQAQERELA